MCVIQVILETVKFQLSHKLFSKLESADKD